MKKHAVFVAGKRFVLLSDDKSEYVEKIAQEINDAIIAISQKNPTLDSRSCAILCALDQADDKYKEVLKNQRFSEKATEVMKQSDKHAKTVKELREELKKAKNLNEKQLHQIADNNVEIKKLSNNIKTNADENVKLREDNKKTIEENKKLTADNKKLNEEISKLKEEIERLKKQFDKEKNNVTTVEKKEEKHTPYQNPVAKIRKTTVNENIKKKSNEKINQMSLFENE